MRITNSSASVATAFPLLVLPPKTITGCYILPLLFQFERRIMRSIGTSNINTHSTYHTIGNSPHTRKQEVSSKADPKLSTTHSNNSTAVPWMELLDIHILVKGCSKLVPIGKIVGATGAVLPLVIQTQKAPHLFNPRGIQQQSPSTQAKSCHLFAHLFVPWTREPRAHWQEICSQLRSVIRILVPSA